MRPEFIGHTSNREGSDIVPTSGPVIDQAYIRNHVRAAEAAGIDRLLIGQFAQWPDNNQIAAYVFSQTERIGALLAHRPGLMAPTLGARQLATLDQFSEGRLWVHIITGGSDTDQARDGDFEDHDTRYARTDEYLTVLKKVWESDQPFDHEGRFYRFKGAFSQVKPFQKPRIPISFGGSSDAAIAVAGKHADVHALWGEPLDGARETIGKVRAAAIANGRAADDIRFTLAFRTVVAETEDAAWAQAADILEKVKSQVARTAGGNGEKLPSNVGSVRLREAASRGKVLDKRLWTEVAEASGAGGNSTALVGTPEQVAEAILDYYDAGVSNFLVRGFYPTEDTVTYGRDVVPLVKAGIAERDARKVAAE
ncbi:LLM class flavin-dependent oxidoreductase [Ensifer sp. ENS09]|uniref:LLM class flavin-dependent oxidoreductase n=1 Tax=Ensifer sp. ENS09 TaxID=2769263 RepID=UPI001780FFDF|nr:LLM class flavin-dependent oxidoreductase [Ensifer sp. ENS09]MBD9650213.1 LLM class flavin-dependent oxidoreductase [Ensifer sp. ENS09]